MNKTIKGFSKLTKTEKITWLSNHFLEQNPDAQTLLKQYWNPDEKLQQRHDEFIENTISNFYLPLGIAPNFIINNTPYAIPMVIEESSVVAAASKAAKFWMERGGFKTRVLGTEKIGHVHFTFDGKHADLAHFFDDIHPQLIDDVKDLVINMEKRGGGLTQIKLIDKTDDLKNYYQLQCSFETLDAMGANFINSCLEQLAESLERISKTHPITKEHTLEVVMSILSNYVPNCIVEASVSCPVKDLQEQDGIDPKHFANKFVQAVNIAQIEPYRAVTHNKGIMNGVDAVVLATGNDFRAVEAGIHAYASRNGRYASLSEASVKNDIFSFSIKLPLALGTVGGLTKLHPLVKLNLELLDNPSSQELMQIVAVAGLAQNFAAVRSLTTTGIQKGHMKMHLTNILNQLDATKGEKQKAVEYFKTHPVSHTAVSQLIETWRNE